MLALVALRNSLTRFAQPQSEGNTKSMETEDTVLLPLKCTLEIKSIAIPAGTAKPAQISAINRLSVLALSESAMITPDTAAAMMPQPDRTAKNPAVGFTLTG